MLQEHRWEFPHASVRLIFVGLDVWVGEPLPLYAGLVVSGSGSALEFLPAMRRIAPIASNTLGVRV